MLRKIFVRKLNNLENQYNKVIDNKKKQTANENENL